MSVEKLSTEEHNFANELSFIFENIFDDKNSKLIDQDNQITYVFGLALVRLVSEQELYRQILESKVAPDHLYQDLVIF